MGVTIHFEGRISSDADYEACISKLCAIAANRGWPVREIREEIRALGRVQNEEDWEYTGITRGVELQPHQNTEPFRFEVDENLFIQEYCKTQFAPVEVHVELVELLRLLVPYFETLSVMDEGEYFETSDFGLLNERLNNCYKQLEELLKLHPGSQGPVRLKSGRIVDIIS